MDVDELFKRLDAFYASYTGKGNATTRQTIRIKDTVGAQAKARAKRNVGQIKGRIKVQAKETTVRDKEKGPCWGCGDPNHQWRQCPKRGNMVWNNRKWVYEMVQGKSED